jgi:hypothetical protein
LYLRCCVSCNRTNRVVQHTACLDEEACILLAPAVQLNSRRLVPRQLLEKWAKQ